MLQRQRVVLAVERRESGQRQRLLVVGVGFQRTRQQPARLAFEVAAAAGRQGVGVVGEQCRIVGLERQRLLEGRARLLVATEHRVGTAEHRPALDVVGLLLQSRRQFFDHGVDLGGRDLRCVGARRVRRGVEGERCTDPSVACEHDDADETGQRGDRRRRQLRRSRRVGGVAIHTLTPQRARQQTERQQRHQRGDQHERRHGRATGSPRSSPASRSSPSSGSKRSGCRRARRRSTSTSTARPPASSTAGPTHNTAVVPFSGGR